MKGYSRTVHSVAAALFIWLIPTSTNAASYTITVPAYQNGGKFFAAYHFNTNTLENVFPPGTLPWGTMLQIWNNATQSYDTHWLDDLELNWYPNADYQLKPGAVFFIINVDDEDLEVTISGTEVSGSYGLTLVPGNWNGYASPKLPGDMLECPCEYGTGMEFPGVNGDQMYWWNPDTQDWVVHTRQSPAPGPGVVPGYFDWSGYCGGGLIGHGFDDGVNPWVTHVGWGAFFTLVGSTNRLWEYSGPVTCGNP